MSWCFGPALSFIKGQVTLLAGQVMVNVSTGISLRPNIWTATFEFTFNVGPKPLSIKLQDIIVFASLLAIIFIKLEVTRPPNASHFLTDLTICPLIQYFDHLESLSNSFKLSDKIPSNCIVIFSIFLQLLDSEAAVNQEGAREFVNNVVVHYVVNVHFLTS